jgi:hypothetical protein
LHKLTQKLAYYCVALGQSNRHTSHLKSQETD